MSAIENLLIAPVAFFMSVWTGLVNLVRLAGMAFAAMRAKGAFRSEFLARLASVEGQRSVFAVLRAFMPNLLLSRSLVRSYENNGTVIVTRHDDVLDVLSRDQDFEVVYEPRMRRITDGENFFLGMQPGWAYTRDVSAMRLAARRTDVEAIIVPRAQARTEELLATFPLRLDLPRDLTQRVPADMVATYFGTPGPSERQMIDWATIMFWYLFSDLGADPRVEEKALDAASECRTYLDQAIAARKADPTDTDDVLNRCLALQKSDVPGMNDLGIRNNLIGLIIGAIPTLSKASVFAMDELLRRPDALARAQKAARTDNDGLLENYIWEALRFNPHQPLVYRRAVRDAVIAPSTLRQRTIPKDAMLLAATLSATFDTYAVSNASAFQPFRTFETYIPWGHGLHTCFGAAINRAVIPAMLKPVLMRPGLRRADGAEGEMDRSTPFPAHMVLEFDAES